MSEAHTQTFMFADLAGFTALTEAHGDEQAAELARGYAESVRELLPTYGGEQIKAIGDAVMLRVPDAGSAVRLALSLLADLGSRPGFPEIRIGMHTGSAVERDGDWFGSAVNLAARIAAAAGGDEVLLSETTREAAGPLEGVDLMARGHHSFKNITAPVTLYAVVGESRGVLNIDPVCRMAVEPHRASGHLVHEGRKYCFCSLECAAAFATDPETYLRED